MVAAARVDMQTHLNARLRKLPALSLAAAAVELAYRPWTYADVMSSR